MTKLNRLGLLLGMIGILWSGLSAVAAVPIRLQNPGFEQGAGQPEGWSRQLWDNSGISEFRLESGAAHSGSKYVTIINRRPNHARYNQPIAVKPDTLYRFSVWIKTQGIPDGQKGAAIGVEGVALGPIGLHDTGGRWEPFELYGHTGPSQEQLTVMLTLGGFGHLTQGEASFDDLSVTELDSAPAGVTVHNLAPDGAENNAYSAPGDVIHDFFTDYLSLEEWSGLAWLILACYLLVAVYLLFGRGPGRIAAKEGAGAGAKSGRAKPAAPAQPAGIAAGGPARLWPLLALIGAGLAFRLILAPLYKGYHFDYRMFWYWSDMALQDFFGLYHPGKVYIDYPPVYIGVLYLAGLAAKLLNAASGSGLYITLIKLPAILADAATALILYRLGRNRIGERRSLIVAGLYLFNPLIWFDSVIWSQIDSVFLLTVLAMLFLIATDRLEWAGVVLAISVLTKPQGLFFAPVLFFELLQRKDWRLFLRAAGAGLATAAAIIAPFSLGNTNPWWFYDLLFKMTGTWSFAAVNGFNLHALFGGNWTPDTAGFLFLNYRLWGYIFLAGSVLFTAFFYLKHGTVPTPFWAALIINTLVFNLAHRMHERYLYPVTVLSLVIYLLYQERRALYLFLATSATNFMNIFLSFIVIAAHSDSRAYASLCRIPSSHPVVIVASFLNLLTLIYVIKLTFDLLRPASSGPAIRPSPSKRRARA
jgi:dolichyl-phosphate-mannose-protein mannosyltransferase